MSKQSTKNKVQFEGNWYLVPALAKKLGCYSQTVYSWLKKPDVEKDKCVDYYAYKYLDKKERSLHGSEYALLAYTEGRPETPIEVDPELGEEVIPEWKKKELERQKVYEEEVKEAIKLVEIADSKKTVNEPEEVEVKVSNPVEVPVKEVEEEDYETIELDEDKETTDLMDSEEAVTQAYINIETIQEKISRTKAKLQELKAELHKAKAELALAKGFSKQAKIRISYIKRNS